jgi:hypothetical protein
MSLTRNSVFKHPHYVTIQPSVQKVIYYNAYEPKTIEYYNEFQTFCVDVVKTGVNILCLCNPQWRLNVGVQPVKVGLKPTQKNLEKFYLRSIDSAEIDDFVYFRVEKLGTPVSSPYACMRQIKAFTYTDRYVRNPDGFPEYIPLAVRSAYDFAEGTHIMHETQFYTWDAVYSSCTRRTPLYMHWNL